MKGKIDGRQEEMDIKSMVSLIHEYELASIPSNEELKRRYQLSDVFYKKMDRLMEEQEKKVRRRKIRRFAAAAAAVAVILFGVANPQMVAEAGEWIIQWFSDHVLFRFVEDAGDVAVSRYEFGYVPKGFQLETDEYYDDIAGYIEFRGEDELWFNLDYGVIDSGLVVNSENMDLFVLTGKKGETIYYLQAQNSGDDSSMTWISEDGTTKFNLMGNVSKEELLKMQSKIHMTK